jgi:hypothetical protein
MVTVGSTATGRAVRRISPATALTAGFLIALAGLIWLSATVRGDAYVADLLPGLLLSGFGHGVIYTATFIIGSRDVPAVHQGTAGALVTTAQYLSGALALAVLTLILGPSRSYPGFTAAFVLLAAGLLTFGGGQGWTAPATLACLLLAAALTGWFLRNEGRSANPLIEPALRHNGSVRAGVVAAALYMASVGSEFYVLTLLLQTAKHYSPLRLDLPSGPDHSVHHRARPAWLAELRRHPVAAAHRGQPGARVRHHPVRIPADQLALWQASQRPAEQRLPVSRSLPLDLKRLRFDWLLAWQLSPSRMSPGAPVSASQRCATTSRSG